MLTMYPYPSGDLHIGHWYAATGPDIVARMRRMQGYNVMFPMGFDCFGLPAENAAIDRGIHRRHVDRQQHRAHARASSRPWAACSTGPRGGRPATPTYYRWTQWLFLKLYEAGLAYKAMAPVDWCPKDQVVLAREQVEGADAAAGAAARRSRSATWSSGSSASRSTRTSCSTSTGVDYPEPIRLMQTNWIGRSEGAEIDFPVEAEGVEPIRVFTTRPDTLFGATFMVLAPEHPLVAALTTRRPTDRCRGLRRRRAARDGDRAPVGGAREERRLHRRVRAQPADR